MRIEELEYHSPGTLTEACALLDSLARDAKIIAGGTDLLADLKQGLTRAKHLVALGGIPDLARIAPESDGGLAIGPLATASALADSDDVKAALAALADAAYTMAGVQIRNLGTIGGNIAGAVASADLAPALLVAGAELTLTTSRGERTLPIAEFLLGPRKTALRPGEILSGIFIPAPTEGTGTAYEKYQLREASALAVVGAAALLTLSGGAIGRAAIAVTAAAPAPFVVEEAGVFLAGKEPSEENFAAAGDIAAKAVKPISDIRGSEEYRRDLARVLATRALNKALERAK